MAKLKLAVLISGRGSNLQALIDACAKPDFPAEIAVVISNVPDAGGLERAAAAGLQAMIVDHTFFKGDKAAFENSLAAIIEQSGAGLICLAGFMRILSADFLNRFKDKVINIHPSLLPAYKGLDTHSRVLKAGDKKHGCSVHVVSAAMDEGDVIAQAEVAVKKGDTEETLAARVLAEEHVLYPDVVRKIATGGVIIRDGRIESKAAIRHHVETKTNTPEKVVMDHHAATPVQADPAAVARARQMWHAFTKASLFAGGAIAVTLVLMAAFLV